MVEEVVLIFENARYLYHRLTQIIDLLDWKSSRGLPTPKAIKILY